MSQELTASPVAVAARPFFSCRGRSGRGQPSCRSSPAGRTACYLSVLAGLAIASACRSPSISSPSSTGVLPASATNSRPIGDRIGIGPAGSSRASVRGRRAAGAEADPDATASFLEATILAWQTVCETTAMDSSPHEGAGALYHNSLRNLIESAQQFGQIDPHHGLSVKSKQIDARFRFATTRFRGSPRISTNGFRARL